MQPAGVYRGVCLWLYHVLGLCVMVRAVSASRHLRFGTCCHLILRTVMLVTNSSSRALRLGSLCKPTHKRRLWELCLSGALQILDLIEYAVSLQLLTFLCCDCCCRHYVLCWIIVMLCWCSRSCTFACLRRHWYWHDQWLEMVQCCIRSTVIHCCCMILWLKNLQMAVSIADRSRESLLQLSPVC